MMQSKTFCIHCVSAISKTPIEFLRFYFDDNGKKNLSLCQWMVIDIMLKLYDNNLYCAGYEQLSGTWLLLEAGGSSTALPLLLAFP